MHKVGKRYDKGQSTMGNALTVGLKWITSIDNGNLEPVLLQIVNKVRCWLGQFLTLFLGLRIWFRWNYLSHGIEGFRN